MEDNKFQSAIEAYSKVIKLNPDFAYSYYNKFSPICKAFTNKKRAAEKNFPMARVIHSIFHENPLKCGFQSAILAPD